MHKLAEKIGNSKKPAVIRKNEAAEKIFADLYNVPSQIRRDYFRIKITEPLIQLSAMEITEQSDEKQYFYSVQIEKINAIHELMISDLTKSYTIDKLYNVL